MDDAEERATHVLDPDPSAARLFDFAHVPFYFTATGSLQSESRKKKRLRSGDSPNPLQNPNPVSFKSKLMHSFADFPINLEEDDEDDLDCDMDVIDKGLVVSLKENSRKELRACGRMS